MQREVSNARKAWTAPKLQRLEVQQAEGAGTKPGDSGSNKKT